MTENRESEYMVCLNLKEVIVFGKGKKRDYLSANVWKDFATIEEQ